MSPVFRLSGHLRCFEKGRVEKFIRFNMKNVKCHTVFATVALIFLQKKKKKKLQCIQTKKIETMLNPFSVHMLKVPRT